MENQWNQADYEKIVIYPRDYDGSTRERLYKLLTDLGVHYNYEQYT